MGRIAGSDAFEGTGAIHDFRPGTPDRRNTVRRLWLTVGVLGATGMLTAGLGTTAASETFVQQEEPDCKASSPPEEFTQSLQAAGIVAGSPEEQRSLENIANIRLTCDGLVRVLSGVNTDYYAYAQSKHTFNPAVMAARGIAQHPTVFYTKHVAGSYYNSDDGNANRPSAEPNVIRFIDAISGRGRVCCGVNQFIDRNGVIYWLAPGAAKLRHNPGYDGLTTGHEKEGVYLHDVSVITLESSAYLDIGSLHRDGLVRQPLQQTIDGHAATRARYNASNPANPLDAKIDWTETPTAAYRLKLAEFQTANPNIANLIPVSFRQLP